MNASRSKTALPLLVRLAGRRDLARSIAAASAIAAVLLSTTLALAARPGGGSSYSGGSKSSGSSRSSGGYSGGGGSSSGDGEAVAWLVLLCFEHPALGLPLLVIVAVVLVVRARSNSNLQGREWTAGYAPPKFDPLPGQADEPEQLRAELAKMRHRDPAFSVVVFEDFLYFLYAEMHRARGAGQIEALSVYLGDQARATLRNDGRVAEVTGIIIGSMTYESVDIDANDGEAHVDVIVESNYVERYRPQGEQRFFAKERIRLHRAAGARSRTPDKARVLNCPNCGGPLSAMRGKVCGYCNTLIEAGTKDWGIESIQVLERETRGPLLTSNVEEKGTNLPTIMGSHVQQYFAQIQAKDPQLNWQRIEQRVGLIFQEFHAGWVGRDPAKIRPFVSDNLFQSQLYWIDLYRTNKCINRTDGSRITKLELVNATTDAYYDAITVRLYATGLDFTVSEDGRLLSGSQSRPRAYSEYWTIIRGAQKKPTDKNDRQCPNCGAPLTINMAGNCQYCAVKVTSGEYDWVLSRIEQDEAYSG